MSIEWFCAGQRCRRAGLLPPESLCHAAVPRLRRDTWLRYRRDLTQLPPREIALARIDAALMETLRRHAERDEPQVRSAFRFWQAGFGDGYVWLDDSEPLCMIWLVTERHAEARVALGSWAGMYPPLPPGVAMAEGLHTFRRGLRRPGGSATPTALALFHEARHAGFSELRTHIHSDNAAARRWAARVGWEQCGRIQRCFFDVRWLRQWPFYLHERCEFAATGRVAADRHPAAAE